MLFDSLKVCISISAKLKHRGMFKRRLTSSALYCNTSQLNSKSSDYINISHSCVDRLRKIARDDVFLRVTVDGGGCSGFQYRFDLDTDLKADDKLFEKDGAKVVVDEISLPFLKGATVDFHEELIRSAFRIIDNPQAESGCSCGASFNVKM